MAMLDGKVAIVTGGGASIGGAITRKLHAEGAKVVIAARNQDQGAKLAEELGDAALFVATDITDDAAIAHLVDATIATFGRSTYWSTTPAPMAMTDPPPRAKPGSRR
ncbi:hypothetical protein GCM10020258_32840 [Sphingomonas yabuuchiae]